jgi:hypothetical protein
MWIGAALAATVCLLCSPAALAHDSRAPAGAPHSWLPDEQWAMLHWLPYDEVRLYDALGVSRRELESWLRDDHRTIADLARRRGLQPRTLARELVAPWRGRAGDRRTRVLEERALRTLTQGHLAQHVFFHLFHGTRTLAHTRAVFGVPRRRFQRLRARGLTPSQIARRGGRSPATARKRLLGVLRGTAAAGVRRHATSRRQAALTLRHQRRLLSCWMRRPAPKFDPGNPYGDPYGSHGRHTRNRRTGLRPGSKQLTACHARGCCWC